MSEIRLRQHKFMQDVCGPFTKSKNQKIIIREFKTIQKMLVKPN